jgi:hypothetical protein
VPAIWDISARAGGASPKSLIYAARMTWPNWTVSGFTPPIPGPVSGGAAAFACSSVWKTWDAVNVIDGDKVRALERSRSMDLVTRTDP